MAFEGLPVNLAVVLGAAHMPLWQFLRMGRGAVVGLDTGDADHVEIHANGHPIARGRVELRGDVITVEVTDLIRKPGSDRTLGLTIGGHCKEPAAAPAMDGTMRPAPDTVPASL